VKITDTQLVILPAASQRQTTASSFPPSSRAAAHKVVSPGSSARGPGRRPGRRCAADLAPARPRRSGCVASYAGRSQREPTGRGPRPAGRRKSQERRSTASVWPQAEATEASCPAPPVSGRSVLTSLATSSAIDAEAPPEAGWSWRPGSVVERRRGRACRLIANHLLGEEV